MTQPASEIDELRVSMERVRSLLDGMVVRGLRACGDEQMAQLEGFIEQLEHAGAGHVGASLEELRTKMVSGDRTVAQALLRAQTSVRLLERLLTLRVVGGQYHRAIAQLDATAAGKQAEDA